MTANQHKIKGRKTIAVAVNTGSKRQLFGSQQFLKDRLIHGFQLHLHPAKSPNNVSTVGTTSLLALNNGYLTLINTDNEQFIDAMPIKAAASVVENFAKNSVAQGGPFMFDQPTGLDIENCFFDFPDTSQITTAEVVLIEFFYGERKAR